MIKAHSKAYKTKEIYIAESTHEHDPMLSEIEFWVLENYGMVVTCSYREKLHKHDLHGVIPVRAKDIRSWCYNDPEEVEKAINSRWVYDPNRTYKRVALYHDSGKGPHIHLQVHPNTRRRL